ncbi:hypothetical protein XA68_14532 [Ophiocordyceps unilateralis]|uniref:DUF3669 domain-containing protein n=1 Tax=Ophiocordyceps unilateralis TaxID=268505 RepID=A0A2A9P8J4_OPHUN|nr:hypothetical protein XA68_14532 [Ophiocordyceps unilateralis]
MSESRDLAIKREDGGPGRSITYEHAIHLRILQALDDVQNSDMIQRWNVPICHGFLRAQDADAWALILPRLPPGYTRCNALISERIPPISAKVRQLLTDRYCRGIVRKSAAVDVMNDDCVIRAYLGRRRLCLSRPSRFRGFSLRNFTLHLDQMEEFGLDLCAYARAIGDALAFLHWKACVDARDVEFVLAPCRKGETAPFSVGQFGEHTIWVLDFDCCSPLALDANGVDEAVKVFYRNDAFYPLPGRKHDTDRWQAFRDRYLEASREFVSEHDEALGVEKLPGLFIDRVVKQLHRSRNQPIGLIL